MNIISDPEIWGYDLSEVEDVHFYDRVLTEKEVEDIYNQQKGNEAMADSRKKLSEITRDEWVAWYWIPVMEAPEFDTFYIKSTERDPSDSIQAGLEYDEWHKAYDEVEKGING